MKKILLIKKTFLALYLELVKKQRMHIGAYLLLLLLTSALQLPIPFILSDIIDSLAENVDSTIRVMNIWLIVWLSAFSLFLSVLSQIYGALLNKRFYIDIRLTVFEGLQKIPIWVSRKYNVTDLQARFTGDVNALNYILPTGLTLLIRHVFFMVAYSCILIYTSSTIMFYILGFLPLAIFIFVVTKHRLSTLSSHARVSYAQTNSIIYESLKGLREGYITGSCKFQLSRLGKALEKSESKMFHTHSYSAFMVGVLGIIPIMVTATIWLVGSDKVASHEITVGQLVSIMMILSMLYGPISGLFEAASGFVYEWVAFKRIAGLINISSDVYKTNIYPVNPLLFIPSMNKNKESSPFGLELRDVNFNYDSTSVFTKLNAIIPAGLCTAFIGANGVGKTTLLSLIMGLDRPSSGIVYLNNSPLLDHNIDVIAQHYGYVPQNIFIFADSLRINITMGRDIPDEHIYWALAELGWEDFITEWDDKLDTVILESGKNLSGGQKQKIALLRALVNKPSVLVLDEPENNLEKQSVEKLVHYLEKIKGQCTVILVTHGKAFHNIIDQTLEL